MTNYLSNRALLAEVHKSKKSFCSFIDPSDADYDAIVQSLDEITPELIAETIAKKANPRIGEKIDPATITPHDLVFRVMTNEHVPMVQVPVGGKGAFKTEKAKVPFPAFKHYRMTADGAFREVCRSHWKGGFDNGEFCVTHGKATNMLARQWMMLCNRYAERYNWRRYSYTDEMISQSLMQLSQVGLYFNESKGENVFAYYTSIVYRCFLKIFNQELRAQNIRDDLLVQAGSSPSFRRQLEGTRPEKGSPV